MSLRTIPWTVKVLFVVTLLSITTFNSNAVAVHDGMGHHRTNFAKRVAGLYFMTETDVGTKRLVALHADGSFHSVSSEQEGGTPGFNPFSDQVGTWTRTGRRQITAKVVDLTYNREPRTLFGFGVVRFVLDFDTRFEKVTGRLEGGVIDAKENPNDLDAKFLFTFASALEAERVDVRFPQEFPRQ